MTSYKAIAAADPRRTILLFILLTALVGFISLSPLSWLAPLLVVSLSLGIGIFIISFLSDEDERKFLFQLFVYAYLARVLIALLLYLFCLGWRYHDSFFGSSSGYYGFFIADGWGYSENGWTIANRLLHYPYVYPLMFKGISVSATVHPYDYVNGIAYFLLWAKSPLSMFFLNSLIGTLTAMFMYFITKLAFDKRTAKTAGLLCAFWPSLFLWSTQNLKEPLTIFLTVLCLWAFVYCINRFNPIPLIIFFLSMFALLNFRSSFAKIILIAIALHFVFFGYRLIRRNPIFLLIVIPVALLILIEYQSALKIILDPMKETQFEATIDMFDEIDYHRRVRASSSLAFMPNYTIDSFSSLLRYLPIGLTVVLLAPFPWQLFSPSQIMAAPEMLIWYFMFPYFIRGFVAVCKKHLMYFFSVLAYTLIIIVTLAILEGNIGTMFRHRSLVMNFMLVILAVGITSAGKETRDT